MKNFNIILALLLSLTVAASCSLLGSNGKKGNDGDGNEPDITRPIVFAATDSAGTGQIFAMKADGSELKQLTHFDGTGSSSRPTWSPDGEEIIFSSFKEGSSLGPALWIMEADGDNQRLLADGNFPLVGSRADWSPDGTKILFDLCLNCQLSTNNIVYVYHIETDQLTKLTSDSPGYISSNAQWSPDGTKIAFGSNQYYVDNDSSQILQDLYIMNADGTNKQRLLEIDIKSGPVWNPSGDKITVRYDHGTPGLYQVDIQTSDISLLEKDISENIRLQPHTWSEDGKRLLVTSLDLDIPGEHTLHIYDTRDSSLINLITKPFDGNPGIIGADWLWEEENSNK